MTAENPRRQNETHHRADVNRARRLQAVRELDLLLKEASEPGFTGSVIVEISAKEGRLGDPVTTRRKYVRD